MNGDTQVGNATVEIGSGIESGEYCYYPISINLDDMTSSDNLTLQISVIYNNTNYLMSVDYKAQEVREETVNEVSLEETLN